MNDENTSVRMLNPAHPGEILRDSIEACEWTVTEAAGRLGVGRQALSRLLNGHSGISPSMALAIERLGWGEADFWMRLQGSWELAQERRRQKAI